MIQRSKLVQKNRKRRCVMHRTLARKSRQEYCSGVMRHRVIEVTCRLLGKSWREVNHVTSRRNNTWKIRFAGEGGFSEVMYYVGLIFAYIASTGKAQISL